MQTQQFDMIELNDDELSLVSGGVTTISLASPVHAGFAFGTGGRVTVAANGDISATAGTNGFAAGLTSGTATITLP
jgi:bacteriocin-like protein